MFFSESHINYGLNPAVAVFGCELDSASYRIFSNAFERLRRNQSIAYIHY
ncbi:MAG: hypothetical protein PHW04_04105 [Candidatus Wallbacteria bacterium]|nr:hypothetical protein [Candidatus Wallbacteria bacterium]